MSPPLGLAAFGHNPSAAIDLLNKASDCAIVMSRFNSKKLAHGMYSDHSRLAQNPYSPRVYHRLIFLRSNFFLNFRPKLDVEEVWDFVLLNRVLSTDVILLKDIFTKAPLSIPMTFLQMFCPILLSVRTLICRHGVKCASVLPKVWT